MSTNDRWAEYLRARAEAHRLMAEQFAAEERAYLMNPLVQPAIAHVMYLREMQASYLKMAEEALAEISTTAQEGNA